jgi:hypothetical protein
VILEPLAVVGSVVEDDVSETHKAVLLACSLEGLLDALGTVFLGSLIRALE